MADPCCDALVEVAQIESAANVGIATATSTAAANAQTESAQTIADAQRDVAQTEADWRNAGNEVQQSVAETTAEANVEAARITAEADADARRAVAETQAQATGDAAQKDADGRRDAAQSQADASRDAANSDAQARVGAAQAAANAQIQAAQLQANADTTVATTRAAGDATVAQISTANQLAVAQADAAARTTVATTSGQFAVQVANIEAGARTTTAGIEAAAADYGADQQLAGVNAHETGETLRLDKKLGFANDKFALLQPLLQQIIDAGSSFLDGGTPDVSPFGGQGPTPAAPMGFRMAGTTTAGDTGGDRRGTFQSYSPSSLRMGPLDPPHDGGSGGGGSSTTTVPITAPYLTTRGVFTPAMLQEQVNAAYARNDARTQALIRKSEGDLAGRGFSANSPILEALKVGYTTANLRASIEAASQIRLQSAQANTDAVFRGQNARSQQYLAQEGVLLEAEKNTITRQVGVLNAVASLIGGIL